MEDELERLKREVYKSLGFNAARYEIKHFRRRVHSRMRIRGVEDYETYLRILRRDPAEKRDLKKALTINVTQFFRNPEVYEAFERKIVPELLKRAERKGSLKIWSLGCATGEEPYSIALIIAHALSGKLYAWKLRIHGTDIDAASLEIARRGVYRDISTIPERFRERFITPLEKGAYTFKDEIKSLVSFRRHDIFSDKPLRNQDAIFCRNTIIYFNRESKRYLYRLFNKSLVPGGYLVLGKTESFINHQDYGFTIAERKSHIFKKTGEI